LKFSAPVPPRRPQSEQQKKQNEKCARLVGFDAEVARNRLLSKLQSGASWLAGIHRAIEW